ncbi:hypothetical protein [Actinocrispum wychmicini]|uniref:Uncharacterized protein n=1 Tax=Actinocrispum wychmicini TaxID=1213861 RepID=A0A4R2IQW8_9PSEU|nr:hypothetical protein [Actinocrispum wychmicini]TCO47327.1 hypothetical protein EV192_11767 [Actinocrispum wychmicini]
MTELAVITSDAIERATDPAHEVLRACQAAKTALDYALEHNNIEQIVEVKSQAEAVRIYTVQKQLGKDAELAAAEIARRAERGLGLAIRKGQQAGTIAAKGARTDLLGPTVGGETAVDARMHQVRRPADFAGREELTKAIYPVTDGVSDERYEAALAEAKVEGNLSRANVVRKVTPTEPAESRRDATDPADTPTALGTQVRQVGVRRRPIVDSCHDAARAVVKDAQRLARLFADDRLPRKREQVADACAADLTQAAAIIAAAITQLRPTETSEG